MPPSRDEQFNALSNAISRVLTPVMICMALSVWFVNSIPENTQCYENDEESKLPEYGLEPTSSSTSTSSESSTVTSIIFISVFVVLIVVFTFLIVWLYKSGRRRFIQIWLQVAVFLVLAYIGGIYIFDFTRSHCIDMDWITLVLIVWNFSIVGLFAVFGRVPRFINQAYLIVISSLMAYIFRSLPGYTVWIILGILVVWDLFAVLAPFGPLNLLVQAARERDDELPALVYDTNPVAPGRDPTALVAKASPFHERKTKAAANASRQQPLINVALGAGPSDFLETNTSARQPGDSNNDNTATSAVGQNDISSATANVSTSPNASASPDSAPGSASASPAAAIPPPTPNTRKRKSKGLKGLFHRQKSKPRDDAFDASNVTGGSNNNNGEIPNDLTTNKKDADPFPVSADGEVKIGTLGTHLKLGLGDFVFYSILVAQASKSGPMTAIASFVAILAGLCATLFLVTVMRKALPALPISITAGLFAYFVTQYAVLPFAENLLPRLLFY